MLILMRFSTGEDWNEFMYDYSNMKDCKMSQTYQDIFEGEGDKPDFQGCGSKIAFAYFISF